MNTNPKRCGAALALAIGVLAAGAASAADKPANPAQAAPATGYREMKWEELIPKGWDPAASFRNENTAALSDADPRAWRLLRKMREVWNNAPTVEALNGSRVRIPGYVVPLEQSRGALKEFLLVPYFGACIHTPPPPANQIIFVTTTTPAKGFRTMDTVWVSGTLSATRVDTFAGHSGYRIEAFAVDRYTGNPPY